MNRRTARPGYLGSFSPLPGKPYCNCVNLPGQRHMNKVGPSLPCQRQPEAMSLLCMRPWNWAPKIWHITIWRLCSLLLAATSLRRRIAWVRNGQKCLTRLELENISIEDLTAYFALELWRAMMCSIPFLILMWVLSNYWYWRERSCVFNGTSHNSQSM